MMSRYYVVKVQQNSKFGGRRICPVADLGGGGGGGGGGVRGMWQLVMYFCINNCTSPSNDYTAVECSNNNQAQLHTHASVPY